MEEIKILLDKLGLIGIKMHLSEVMDLVDGSCISSVREVLQKLLTVEYEYKKSRSLHYRLDQCEGKGHLPPLLLKLENLLSFSRTQVGSRLVIILNIFLMIDDSHDLSKAGLMRHLRLFSSSN